MKSIIVFVLFVAIIFTTTFAARHKTCASVAKTFTTTHPGWTGTLVCLPGVMGRRTVVVAVESKRTVI